MTSDPVDLARDVRARGPRRRPRHAAGRGRPRAAVIRAAAVDAVDHDRGRPRVHRQRPQLLREPAGPAGVRHGLDPRCGRHRPVGGGPACRRATSGRHLAGRGLPAGSGPRPVVRLGRCRPRPGTPALPDREGARRCAARVGHERRGPVARPRLPAPARAPGVGGHRQHQVAGLPRGRHPQADLAVEHHLVHDDRRRLPGRIAAADREPGALRVGAPVGGGAPRRPAGPADRPVVERCRAASGGSTSVSTGDDAGAQPSSSVRVAGSGGASGQSRPCCRAARTSCRPARPTRSAAPSRSRRRTTATATSSTRSSGTL